MVCLYPVLPILLYCLICTNEIIPKQSKFVQVYFTVKWEKPRPVILNDDDRFTISDIKCTDAPDTNMKKHEDQLVPVNCIFLVTFHSCSK